MATTFDVIYLGNFADLDPTEGNTTSENAAALVGQSFGSAGAPLANNQRTLSPVGSPGATYSTDNTTPEQYDIDGTTYTHDAVAVYTALVTFADGTTAEVPVVLFQTTTGDVYLAPATTGSEDTQALMESQPIISMEVVSMDANAGDFGADRLASNYADTTVDGTTGHDEMRYGYTDADGTSISGRDDVINAGDGNDYVEAGGGSDTIDGGAGSDAIFGDMAGGDSKGSLKIDVTDNLADGGDTETLSTRAVELVTLANGDLILITSERTSASHDGIATWRVDNDPSSDTYGQITSGQLDRVQEPSMPNGGAGYDNINDMAAITLSNGSTFVFTADSDRDAIGISKIELDGTITPQTSVIDGTNLDGVQEISVVEVGGQPVLLALGGGSSDTLVSYLINDDGSLTQADTANDATEGQETFIEGGAGGGNTTAFLESFTNSSGDTFVVAGSSSFAGGENDGISLFSMDATGQLTWQNGRADEAAGAGETDQEGLDLSRDVVSPANTGLNDAEEGVFAEIDGQTYFFVGGHADDVDVFRVDLDTVNNDGTFYLTLVGHMPDLVTNISSMAVLDTDDGPVLVIGGEQNSLEFHAVNVDGGTGEVTLTLVDTLFDGEDGADKLGDSESIDVEGGLLVTASDGDSGLVLMDTGLTEEVQTAGADSITGGAGDDLVMGGGGADTVDGGTGNDVIYGDGATDRSNFSWEGYSDQNVRDGFTQDVGDVAVTFTTPDETGATLTLNTSDTQYTFGMDDDGTGVDPYSAFASTLANTSSRGEYGWSFSKPVTNVTFNITDLDAGERVQIFAYDASGNPISVTFNPGANVSVSDSDADGINDQLDGSGTGSASDAAQAVTVSIPGPVTSIQVVHTLTSGSNMGVNFTEMFFDVPVAGLDGGNDSLTGGDGDDTLFGGTGDDTVSGGANSDTIFGDSKTVSVFGSELLTNPSFDSDISGWTVLNPSGGPAPYHESSQSVAVNQSDEAAGGDGLEQSITTTAGGVYDVTVDLGQIGGGTGVHTAQIDVLDSNGNVIATQSTTIGQGQSKTVDFSFTALDGTSTLRITNPSSTSSTTTDLAIKGASVVQTAEPATGGADVLDGGTGDDLIVGGEGGDSITGGAGNDTIYGDEGETFLFNTDSGQLHIYDATTGTTEMVTNGLMAYGDIVTTPDGKVYGVVLDASDGGTDAGVYEIDLTTGSETLVYDLADGGLEWYAGLGSDPDGNLYITDNTNFTVTRIEPDGVGGFINPTTVLSYGADITDVEFIDSDTAWVIYGTGAVETYDVDGAGVFTNPTTYGAIPGAADLTGITLAENGLIYVTDVNGGVFSTDPTSLPPTWTPEELTDNTLTWGSAAVPVSLQSSGDDTIDGGTGDDVIVAGGGSDTINLTDGFGNDTVSAGEDADGLDVDTLDASGVTTGGVTVVSTDENGTLSDGTDTVRFTDVERFVLTDQADTFTAFGTDPVTVLGGAGDDTLQEGHGTSSLSGGDDADTFQVGFGTATIVGGEGGTDFDTLSFAVSDDAFTLTFSGNEAGSYTDNTDSDSGTFSQIEAVEGSSGADTIDASADGSGVALDGAGGADTITGGSGNDTITGGTGDDLLTGGGGNDVFVYTPGDGLDVITDFNVGNTGPINDANQTNNDFIDLSGYYDNLKELWADEFDDGILNQSNTTDTEGTAVDYSDNTQFAPGEGIDFQGASADQTFYNVDNTNVVCFAAGTLIRTPFGEVPIELLTVGDLVITRDNGPQPILWLGGNLLNATDLEAAPHLKPICLSARKFGIARDLVVSPQHGILLRARDRGGTDTLYRATHLASLNGGARVMHGCRMIQYHHLMFAEHQVISAGGLWSESLYPGQFALAGMSERSRREIYHLFPDLARTHISAAYGPALTAYSRRRDLPPSLAALSVAR